ncbi:hypothetical protein ITX49_16825 [Enterococcus casseliflavus]|uniref:hypothetical protein n=1 Tax=Enterococcus TaxID=1350 RepID=UPI001A2C2739|nr:hypothetical protein [Enterococcus casseliflavus]MBJ0457585.1 hypothetical protein [Enterococcus faecium]MBZ3642845.1 hypothetical protein [Enterococcus casseliflavus]MDT2974383.1 hypothetical protein [Enterococcus casseliflavus]UBL09872.1 hypothetical protein [Enterococcus casseliflavus]
MAVTKRKSKIRAVTSVCSLSDIENRALSIRLFDRTIWINMGDGRIINPQTKEIEALIKKFDEIRTATLPGKIVFAKRYNRWAPLCLVEKPYKIRS